MKPAFRFDPAEPVDPLSNFDPPEYNDDLERALAEETADRLQCKPFLQITPQTPVGDAIRRLHDHGVSSLLVVHENRLVGIFTERDVLEKVVEGFDRNQHQPVSDFMTCEPTIIYDSDPIAAAAAAISVAGHRHVPVLDFDENVYGLVSARRLFDFIENHDQPAK